MVRHRDTEWQELSHKKKCESNYVCQTCGGTHGLVLHHVNKDSYDDSDDNLIVLCAACHDEAHYPGCGMKPIYVMCQTCKHYSEDACVLYEQKRNAVRFRKCIKYEALLREKAV